MKRILPKNRWLRLGLYLGGIAAIVATLLAVQIWRTERASRQAYERIIARIDAEDPGWRWDDLRAAEEPLPDAENSFILLKKVFDLHPKDLASDPLEPGADPYSSSTNFNVKDIWVFPEQMPPDLADWSGSFVGRRAKAIAIARSLAEMPHGRHHVVYTPDVWSTLLPTFQPTRELATLLDTDALVHAQLGDMKTALTDVRAILNAARSLDATNGFLIAQLVRTASTVTACNSLQAVLTLGTGTEEELRRLQEELRREGERTILPEYLRFERGACHEAAVYLQSSMDPKVMSKVLPG